MQVLWRRIVAMFGHRRLRAFILVLAAGTLIFPVVGWRQKVSVEHKQREGVITNAFVESRSGRDLVVRPVASSDRTCRATKEKGPVPQPGEVVRVLFVPDADHCDLTREMPDDRDWQAPFFVAGICFIFLALTVAIGFGEVAAADPPGGGLPTSAE